MIGDDDEADVLVDNSKFERVDMEERDFFLQGKECAERGTLVTTTCQQYQVVVAANGENVRAKQKVRRALFFLQSLDPMQRKKIGALVRIDWLEMRGGGDRYRSAQRALVRTDRTLLPQNIQTEDAVIEALHRFDDVPTQIRWVS